MTKWFDTNYDYMVPEVSEDQDFVLTSEKPVDLFLEARELGIRTRPVILGPVTFLKLAMAPAPMSFDVCLSAISLMVFSLLPSSRLMPN